MSDINWNAELRKIEREFDGLPPEPSAAAVNARRAAERSAKQRQEAHSAALGIWARLALVAALAGSLPFWPYTRECGPGLFVYIGSQALIMAGALWVISSTWRWRMARTHGLALIMLLWALGLIGMQVLPRIGYAKVDATRPPQWWCAEGIRPRIGR